MVRGIFNHIVNGVAILAGALIAFTVVSVTIDVAARYFLRRPQFWVLESVEYALAFIVFTAAAWVLRKEGHVSVDILITRFQPGTKAVINALTSLLGAILCLVISYYGATAVWDHFQRGTAMVSKNLAFPVGALIIVVPLGFFLLFMQFLFRSNDYWKARTVKTGKEEKTQARTIEQETL